ncbi:MAG TPA: 30S ribosomal protein S4 [Dehalococcoidia bacterium]|nr:30S ribosomal protein S4 [Dehalococcoidia bacterium]
MARYTDARCRLCRRLGEKLYLKGDKCYSNCVFDKRPYPPGMRSNRRRKVSDRGLQWREKQKARAIYGVLESQFRKYYEDAVRRPGVTGETLLRTLELRMDNVVFRLGFADSRQQARQIVSHGLFTVNGRKTTIPSRWLKVGDTVGWSPRGDKSEYYKISVEKIASKETPSWVSRDDTAMTGKVEQLPEIDEIGALFNPATIVEYYSR